MSDTVVRRERMNRAPKECGSTTEPKNVGRKIDEGGGGTRQGGTNILIVERAVAEEMSIGWRRRSHDP
jgi:hypothetical protein